MTVEECVRLYLVTDRALARGRPLEDVIRPAVAGGVTAVQLREKDLDSREFYETALRITALLRGKNVPLFINDRVDVAIAAGTEGIHVGQQDLPAHVVRRMAPPGMLLGVSVATPEEAHIAEIARADYVSVSPVFLTPTKPDATGAVGLEGVQRIRAATRLPLLAIGGIGVANARAVIEAGADGVSVVSAVMSAEDPEAAARELLDQVQAGLRARAGER